MSLPAAWVESLFARLSVRYGAAFMRQYADLDVNAVKADWAEVLGGFVDNPAAIRYGLEHVPTDRPINAMQFRAICNTAPESAPLAIPNNVLADPARVAELVATVKPRQRDSKDWARRLRDIELNRGGLLPNGSRMTRAQREMWRTALASEEQPAEAA